MIIANALRQPGTRWQRYFLPSPTALVFAFLAGLVPILLQKPMLNSDGDLARHLAHGRYMLEQRQLIRADPFSFTRPGAPFVGFEYGSQVLYALVERFGGLPAVAVLAGLLIGSTYALLLRLLLARGVDPLFACITVGMAIGLGAGHWNARPHLFSFVAVVLLLRMLEGRPRKAIPATGLLFAIWANLHGGFVYGWILILIYLTGSLGELLWGGQDSSWRARVRYYLLMLAAAAVATLLNPHGFNLHRHLFDFFTTPYLMNTTAEFASPDFHESSGKIFLALLVTCVLALSLHRPRPALPRLLLICVGTAFALLSVRNIPLFGLTALPVLALHLNDLWRRVPDPGGVRGRFETTAGATSTLSWTVAVTLLLLLLASSRGRVGSVQLIQDEFDSSVFPVRAVAEGRSRNLEGRLFSEFAWGGYLLYAWPGQKIFIDGGTDFFGEDVFREYVHIKQMNPGWRGLLAQREISSLLLEREKPFTYELARGGGWLLWYCDSLAVVFRRSTSTSGVTPATADSIEQVLNRCGERPSHPLGERDE